MTERVGKALPKVRFFYPPQALFGGQLPPYCALRFRTPRSLARKPRFAKRPNYNPHLRRTICNKELKASLKNPRARARQDSRTPLNNQGFCFFEKPPNRVSFLRLRRKTKNGAQCGSADNKNDIHPLTHRSIRQISHIALHC